MADYIDREKIFSIWRSMPAPASVTSLAAAISQTPAADVVEVRHGRWNVVEALSNDIQTAGECNICGENISWFGKLPNYCPNCGARMDKEDEHEVG